MLFMFLMPLSQTQDIPVGEPQTLCGVRKYLPHSKDLPGQVTSLSHFAAEL